MVTGHYYATVAADKLRAQFGLVVVQAPLKIRPDYQDRHRYADEDLEVEGRLVEVKSRDFVFTGPHDWPDNRNPAYITNTLTWGRKKRKPVAVLFISQVTRGLAVVPMSSEPHWTVERVFDRLRGENTSWAVDRRYLRTVEDLAAWFKPVVHPPAPALITADLINWGFGNED